MTTEWRLRVYVAGKGLDDESIVAGIRRLCAERLPAPCCVEIVDLAAEPARARRDGILATPTLVRLEPTPERRVIGDLADLEAVAIALGMGPVPAVHGGGR